MKYSIDELERHSLAYWQNQERIGDLLGLIADADLDGQHYRVGRLEMLLKREREKEKRIAEMETK